MDKETQVKIVEIEGILRKLCGFDYDGYVNSFNCYSGAKAIYEAGYRKLSDECKKCTDWDWIQKHAYHSKNIQVEEKPPTSPVGYVDE